MNATRTATNQDRSNNLSLHEVWLFGFESAQRPIQLPQTRRGFECERDSGPFLFLPHIDVQIQEMQFFQKANCVPDPEIDTSTRIHEINEKRPKRTGQSSKGKLGPLKAQCLEWNVFEQTFPILKLVKEPSFASVPQIFNCFR